MQRSYERLSIEDFGQQLLETGDLDPAYGALVEAVDDFPQLYRWLLAYWCTYHVGLSSFLSEHEGSAFWDILGKAAWNNEPSPIGKPWPRGLERRHWRGTAAVSSFQELRSRYSRPEGFVEYLREAAPSYSGIVGRVQEHAQFGPWIAFKIADMLERCTDTPVDFSTDDVFMFETPQKAAVIWWAARNGDPDPMRAIRIRQEKQQAISEAVQYLGTVFRDFQAPPFMDRLVGLQEIETILCKWKSHLTGHYPVGIDTHELGKAAAAWAGVSETARRFQASLPVRIPHPASGDEPKPPPS